MPTQLLSLHRHLLPLPYMQQLTVAYRVKTQTTQCEIDRSHDHETHPRGVVPGIIRVGLTRVAFGVDLQHTTENEEQSTAHPTFQEEEILKDEQEMFLFAKHGEKTKRPKTTSMVQERRSCAHGGM